MGIFEGRKRLRNAEPAAGALGEVCGLEHFDARGVRRAGRHHPGGHFDAGDRCRPAGFSPPFIRCASPTRTRCSSARPNRARTSSGACIDRGDLRGMLPACSGATAPVWYRAGSRLRAQNGVRAVLRRGGAFDHGDLAPGARFMKRCGAAVLAERRRTGATACITDVERLPSADRTADTARINQLLIGLGARAGQVLLGAPALKARPTGEPPVYLQCGLRVGRRETPRRSTDVGRSRVSRRSPLTSQAWPRPAQRADSMSPCRPIGRARRIQPSASRAAGIDRRRLCSDLSMPCGAGAPAGAGSARRRRAAPASMKRACIHAVSRWYSASP